jgi:hypothetical protein
LPARDQRAAGDLSFRNASSSASDLARITHSGFGRSLRQQQSSTYASKREAMRVQADRDYAAFGIRIAERL